MISFVVLLGATVFLFLSSCAVSFAEPESLAANLLADDQSKLFAIVGGSSCAEDLIYGPQDITASGSSDGQYQYYLSTKAGSVPHDTWMQVVTDGETRELFRIYWSFSSRKTVTERVVNAVSVGETVSYRVAYTSISGYPDQYYTGKWRFSSASGITANTFLNSASQCCLSVNSGAWGAGTGTIDGSAGYVASSFWGIGNFGSSDSTSCYQIYRNGIMWWDQYTSSKSYMYFDTFYQPTFMPTSAPIGGSVVSMKVEQNIDGASYSDYMDERIGCNEVMTEVVTTAIPGILPEDVRDFVVFPRYHRRNLQDQSAEHTLVPHPQAIGHAQDKELLSGGCRVEYYVTAPTSRGISYSQMSQSLQNYVNSNQFTMVMQSYATQRNVVGLQSATSDSVIVQNDVPGAGPSGSGGSTATNPALIGGIVVGCLMGVSMLIWVYIALTRGTVRFKSSAIGYSNPPGASPVPYNVPPAQGMVSSQDPGYSTVNAGVEMPGVCSSGGVKASAPPAVPSSSFFSFGRTDPSHTRW